MSDTQLHPENGIRVLFEIEDATSEQATYTLSLFTPDDKSSAQIKLTLGTTPEGTPWPPETPKWATTYIKTLMKQIMRTREASPRKTWPHRILRWREEKKRS